MQNLAEFVTEKGGGLLFVAGAGFNPLHYKASPWRSSCRSSCPMPATRPPSGMRSRRSA